MRKVALVVVLVLMASGAQAVTLNVIGGILHGASGVDVGGALYDVEFGQNSGGFHCAFGSSGGCWTFTDAASASLASQALLDQVFVDLPLHPFDALPELTAFIPAGAALAEVVTPYDYSAYVDFGGIYNETVWYAAAINRASGEPLSDSVFQDGYFYGGGELFNPPPPASLFAVWTQVPEPSTALLLGLGLVGLAARRRA